MQFTYILLLAFITSAAAQGVGTGTISGDLAALPECARDCIGDATLAAGCSSAENYICQCGTARSRIEDVAIPCVTTKCMAEDLDSIYALTNEICDLVATSQSSSSVEVGSPSTTAAPSDATAQSTGRDASPTNTDDSADTTSSSTPPASNSKPVPVGAIVGGVVGGLAVIALFAFAVIVVVIRSRRNRQNNPSPPPHQSPQDGYSKPEFNPQNPAQPYIPPPFFPQGEAASHPQLNQQSFQQQQPPNHELDSHTSTQAYPQQGFAPNQQPLQQPDQQALQQQQPQNSELDSHTPTQAYPQQAFIPSQSAPQQLNQQTSPQQQLYQPELDSRPTNPTYSQQPYVPSQVPPQLRDGSTVYEAA